MKRKSKEKITKEKITSGLSRGEIHCRLQCFLVMILLAMSIFFFFSPIHARTIWRIGDPNNASNSEFGHFDQSTVSYQVPEDWNIRKDWTSFPRYIRPPESSFAPKEIHIIYTYLQDYRSPILRIGARLDANITQGFVVLKGEKEIPILTGEISRLYTILGFPLGIVQKGLHKDDEIIIKDQSTLAEGAVFFDYLELDDQDEDGDWSLDSEEKEGDTDQDGIEDKLDPDTASILIQSSDQTIKKRITLDIQEQEGLRPCFQRLTLLDNNSPEFPPRLPENIFLPYGLFRADIQIIGRKDALSLRISYPGSIYLSLAKFYLYNESDGWQEIPIEIDGNTIEFSLLTEKEENKTEKQREMGMEDDGLVTVTGGLAYPSGMNTSLKEYGCFISSISRLRSELTTPLLIFLLILFLFPWYFAKGSSVKSHRSRDNALKRLWAKRYMIILIALQCLFFRTASAYAITFPDMSMSATPNPVGSGARALGIGGAFIAVADDATAASWNPAALLKLKRSEISIVGSGFLGEKTYHTSTMNGEIEDLSHDQKHLNYLSAVFPFVLLQRNIVFSLNYQHLYEFSQDTSYKWTDFYEEPGLGPIVDIPKTSHKRQKGALNAFSPALAVQIIPSLYLGITTNFWLTDELNNYWENLNIVEGNGKTLGDLEIKTHAEYYERYDFSGFNANIGLLWQPNRWLTFGGVIKTPFEAKIKHRYRFLSMEEYPQDPARNYYNPRSGIENLTLRMPVSYGLGTSIRFSDSYLMALDIYHTQWEDYILCDSSGESISPINNEPKNKANIKPTTQIRLGAEYLIVYPKPIIPLRCGIFYDPEPASRNVDDFYGASLGTGIVFKNIAFDIAYQYRFGRKRRAEVMLGKDISSDVNQHYFYSSMVFYF